MFEMAFLPSSDLKNAPEDVLKDCMCTICNCYLSVEPIRMVGNKIVCGRCDGDGIRLHPYEAMAKQLKFPCRYNSHGCPTYLEWRMVDDHEQSCDFQMVACATHDCPWLVTKSTLRQHFEIQHPTLIINNEKTVDMDIVDKNQMAFLYATNNFVCKVNVLIEDDKFKHNVIFFASKGEVDKYVYDITFLDHTKILTYRKQKVQTYSNRLSYLNVDIDLKKIKSIFEGVTTLTLKIAVDTNVDVVGINEYDLECPICLKKMIGSIIILPCGHSICMYCRSNIVACPICRRSTSSVFIRNYTLENIIQKL